MFKGVPWEPIPGIGSYDLRSKIVLPVDRPEEGDVEVQEREFAHRRYKISKSDIEAHGPTIGCPACTNILRGKRPGNHNETCRARIDRELSLRGDSRVVKEVEEMLGEAVDPAEIRPQDDMQDDELSVEVPEKSCRCWGICIL